MKLVIISLVLNFIMIFGALDFDTWVIGLFVSFWLLSLVGTLIFLSTQSKISAIAAMIGFGFYFPLGLIGVFGIRNILDQLDSEKRNPHR